MPKSSEGLYPVLKTLIESSTKFSGCELKFENITLEKLKQIVDSYIITKKLTIDLNKFLKYAEKVTVPETGSNFFRLALYWSLWADIMYYDVSVITEFVEGASSNGKKYLKLYNTISEHSVEAPFFALAVDHFSRSIVIAIRGTNSVSDGITDILGLLVPFLPEDPEAKAHKGFVGAAFNIVNLVKDDLIKYVNDFPWYDIKIVGHSYGAGVSSLVAYILNSILKIRGNLIRAIGYCCPPVFNDYCAKKICITGFVTCFVMGWDIVARASISNGIRFSCKLSEVKEKEIENAYVPGRVFWITYDDNSKLEDMYLIYGWNETLQHIPIHPYILEDHSMSKMVAALMTYVSKRS